MKALLIKVDFSTGKRAGDISPTDPNLPCHGWQDLDKGLEIRLVEDDRELSQYEDVVGVTIIEGKEDINQAIQDNIPTRYGVIDKELLLAHMKERGISLDTLAGKTLNGEAETLFNKGLAGITERKPKLV